MTMKIKHGISHPNCNCVVVLIYKNLYGDGNELYDLEIEHCDKHATASDLLEALNEILDGLDANYDERLGLTNQQWEQRIKNARQAIALAEGRE
jgi:hypothetical protein